MSPNSKTVFLVRHGESIDNTRPVFQSFDAPLSPSGKVQAEQLARCIKALDFQAIVTSPQPRAMETALVVARYKEGLVPEKSALLIERMIPSSLYGMARDNQAARQTWSQWEAAFAGTAHIEGSENYYDLVTRADKALDFLQSHRSTMIVVISHHHFIRTIVARTLLGNHLRPDTLRRIYELTSLDNTSITELRFALGFDGSFCWQLTGFNDDCHIEPQSS